MKTIVTASNIDIYPFCNESAKEFLNRYLVGRVKFIGLTNLYSRKDEIFCLYQWLGDAKICACVLQKKESQNRGNCFFGDLRYFARYIQEQHPTNKGKRDPFYFSVKTEKRVLNWLNKAFNMNLSVLDI